MPTVHDIARHAGVAVGTVSRVLHHHPAVREEMRRCVWRAVEELDYRPLRRHAGRQMLRHVGVVTLGMDRWLAALPVIGCLLHGVHDALRAQDITLSLIDIPQPEIIPNAIISRGVDAMIVKAVLRSGQAHWPVPLRAALSAIPHVWLTGRPDGFTGDTCGVDDYAVGATAAHHLLSCGHRRLAILNPDPGHLLFARRCAAFRQVAEQAGAIVRILECHTACPPFPCPPVANLPDVLPLVDQLLAVRPRLTGLFTPSDSIATQVYRALAMRGCRVTDDISIVSANHEASLLAGLHPRLTTIDIHAEEAGSRAVELLFWRMAHPDASEQNVQLSPTLVPGESVAMQDDSGGSYDGR